MFSEMPNYKMCYEMKEKIFDKIENNLFQQLIKQNKIS